MILEHWLIVVILVSSMIVTVAIKKLTVAASIAGGIVGALVYIGAGYVGVAMVAAFFVLGTTATSWKIKSKERLKIAERDKGRRTAGQVLANAGVAALLGLLILIFPLYTVLFHVMMAASLASATADTMSSELGNLYGTKYYNILTLKKDARGLDGVISAEGTLIGIAGSILIATVYAIGFSFDISFLWIVIGGTVGNIADSVLGATLERRNYLNNNAVNFLNTLVGAITACALSLT
jgi:uncharacterized protein (TIGR00297 family)